MKVTLIPNFMILLNLPSSVAFGSSKPEPEVNNKLHLEDNQAIFREFLGYEGKEGGSMSYPVGLLSMSMRSTTRTIDRPPSARPTESPTHPMNPTGRPNASASTPLPTDAARSPSPSAAHIPNCANSLSCNASTIRPTTSGRTTVLSESPITKCPGVATTVAPTQSPATHNKPACATTGSSLGCVGSASSNSSTDLDVRAAKDPFGSHSSTTTAASANGSVLEPGSIIGIVVGALAVTLMAGFMAQRFFHRTPRPMVIAESSTAGSISSGESADFPRQSRPTTSTTTSTTTSRDDNAAALAMALIAAFMVNRLHSREMMALESSTGSVKSSSESLDLRQNKPNNEEVLENDNLYAV